MSDCSPANRGRELGLDRRETGQFSDELDTATVVEVSTRGTRRARIWQRWFDEKLVLQGYRLLGND